MNSTNKIRLANLDDLNAIQNLAIQLDYNPSIENVRDSLTAMMKNPVYQVVVAVKEGIVVGWMTLQIRLRIEDVPFLQIAAVVTDQRVRGQGYGRALINYAEEQARLKKLNFLGLHSSKRRTKSHQFYKNAGFIEQKESLFFSKDII